MKHYEMKKLSAAVTLAVAIVFLGMGIALLLLKPDISMTISVIVLLILTILTGITESIALFKDGKKKEGVLRIIIYAVLTALIFLFSLGFFTALNILYAIIALVLFAIRVMICIHLAKNGGKHIVRNAIAGLFCLAFGIILLILPPATKVLFMVYVVGIFLILYSINYFGDFFAAVLKTDMKERKHRRIHISLPNLFTVGSITDQVAACEAAIKDDPNASTFILSSTNNDPAKVNFEVLVHVNKENKSMGHIDVCVDDMVFAYGDYDERTKILGGLYGGGTCFTAPKKPYINNCIRTANKYILGYGAELLPEQLEAVKRKMQALIDCSTELTLEEALAEGRTDDDYMVVILKMGGRTWLVKTGEYKEYFGLATNCVCFANTLMGEAGFEDLSQGSLKTPGAYVNMLEEMLYRSNTRMVQKTAYVKVDE